MSCPCRVRVVEFSFYETLTSAKQALNSKLQSSVSVAAYLRCGGVVNDQIKKGLLLSL